MTFRRNKRWLHQFICCLLIAATAGGCRSTSKDIVFDRPTYFKPIGTQIEYADACLEPAMAVEEIPEPHTLKESDLEEFDYWELTLDEVIQFALSNSPAMRDLGARVLSAPEGVTTTYDVALQQMNPRAGGEEAALSAFDAQFAASLFFNKVEATANRGPFQVNGVDIFPDRTSVLRNGNFQAEISKVAATGTQLAIRTSTDYFERQPQVNPLFENTYDTVFEAEFRHPLLRGGGVAVNQIARPGASPGFYNGIIIARLNTDIALADFETAVRDFLFNVYDTYWRLYFSYRNLQAQRDGLESAREAWRTANVKLQAGAGDGLEEALSQTQFFDFQARVQNALSGSNAFTGIFKTERELRRLIGVPINDGRLIRPADEPSRAEALFDWHQSLFNAVNRRVELRRQRWNIRKSEAVLLAARNQLLVQLDLVGQYRWSGFGDDLLGNRSVENGSAFRDLFTGDLQGWQMGIALSTPIGNRLAHAAVRHAELSIARERTLLREQEQEIHKDVSDAFNELSRAYRLTRTRFNQINAAGRRLDLTKVRFDAGDTRFEFVLDAESDLSDAQSEFFGSLTNYNIALAAVHRSTGTFLDYLGVELTEGPWSPASHRSAMKEARRFKTRDHNYCVKLPCAVSNGTYRQHALPRGVEGEILEQSENEPQEEPQKIDDREPQLESVPDDPIPDAPVPNDPFDDADV